jgi:hypothetical protein
MKDEESDFQQRMQHVERLTQQLERCGDPATRSASQELVAVLLQMHGLALAKMLALLGKAGDSGRSLVESFARDRLIASVLLLHNLHPEELTTRVRHALDSLRPQLHAHHRDVELLSAEGGIVRLRLRGSGSIPLLEKALREAIDEAAPDREGLEIEVADEGPPPVSRLFSLPMVSGH